MHTLIPSLLVLIACPGCFFCPSQRSYLSATSSRAGSVNHPARRRGLYRPIPVQPTPPHGRSAFRQDQRTSYADVSPASAVVMHVGARHYRLSATEGEGLQAAVRTHLIDSYLARVRRSGTRKQTAQADFLERTASSWRVAFGPDPGFVIVYRDGYRLTHSGMVLDREILNRLYDRGEAILREWYTGGKFQAFAVPLRTRTGSLTVTFSTGDVVDGLASSPARAGFVAQVLLAVEQVLKSDGALTWLPPDRCVNTDAAAVAEGVLSWR